jgi:quinohemoprotein ethanol dehydrogenase
LPIVARSLIRRTVRLVTLSLLVASAARASPAGVAGASASDQQRPYGQVTNSRLEGRAGEPGQWMTEGGDWQGSYYSPLAAINAGNVRHLGFAWEFKTGTFRGLEATPLVVDGVMYASGNWGIVYALDARNGSLLWRFNPHYDGQVARYSGAADVANRGVAVFEGRVFVVALDCRLYALNARTGGVLWQIATNEGPKYTCTGRPTIAGRVVVVGNGGGDFGAGGVRGYVSAYALDTGRLKWRFYTVPSLSEARPALEMQAAAASWDSRRDPTFGGGGTVWDGMGYDPHLGLVYFGTGNAAPYLADREINGRPVDRLYAASIIALHADTGRMAWYYQTTPGDIWDFDATAPFVLADLVIAGSTRSTLIQANKNGYFYVLDRTTGQPISAKAFTYINWSSGLDPNFRPIVRADATWGTRPRMIYPGIQGAHAWAPMSYNPKLGLAYIPVMDAPYVLINVAQNPGSTVKFVDSATHAAALLPDKDYRPEDATPLYGELPRLPAAHPKTGGPLVRSALLAWDPVHQRAVWRQQTSRDYLVLDGGVLATAGNLVFAGREDGYFVAYAADTGKVLKQLDTGVATMAAPMTYDVDGTQYIAVMQGHGGGYMASVAGTAALRYVNEGRILALKLGGTADIPKPKLRAIEPRQQPPPRHGSTQDIVTGRTLFYEWCSACHTLGLTSITPDLTRLDRGIGDPQVFRAIVLKGALTPLGMSRFDEDLTEKDADALHAFLVDQAWQEYEVERREAHVPPTPPQIH